MLPTSHMLSAGALTLAVLAAPAAAQDITKTNRLSAGIAFEMASAAVEICAKQDQYVTAVVLDAAGSTQAFLRGDHTSPHTIETADYKAFTALSFRTDSINLVERAKTGNVPVSLSKLPRLLLAQGGVLIKVGEEIVGVIGVSGARGNNIDTQCARAAIDKVKDRLK
jgi:uncharacterized protein GlcG (DUF336 family)